MLTEAIRAHLTELGIDRIDELTDEQVIRIIDSTLKELLETDPEAFADLVSEFLSHVKSHLLTVKHVLTDAEDLLS